MIKGVLIIDNNVLISDLTTISKIQKYLKRGKSFLSETPFRISTVLDVKTNQVQGRVIVSKRELMQYIDKKWQESYKAIF